MMDKIEYRLFLHSDIERNREEKMMTTSVSCQLRALDIHTQRGLAPFMTHYTLIRLLYVRIHNQILIKPSYNCNNVTQKDIICFYIAKSILRISAILHTSLLTQIHKTKP